ncbi:MAG: adenine phosphoribosyltransferase [Planctomycetota bacterium]|jgi:adenine phosphoribosyltransferase
MVDIKTLIRDIPDFPKPGILFRDITPLLKNLEGLKATIQQMADVIRKAPCEMVVGTESRGFIFGAPLALELGVGFVPIRKPGKLPHQTRSASYELEYGTDTIEIHEDALQKGQKVALVDDLLATGGTMAASCELVESLGAEVASVTFVIELAFLKGREKLKGYNVESLIIY